MKKYLLLLSSFFLLLGSCSKQDIVEKHIYLAAKYNLTYAAFNESYEVSDEPAYSRYISGSTNCIDLFDIKNTFCIYNTRIENNLPIGFGCFNFEFKSYENKVIHHDFEYICYYNGVYGGTIVQKENSKVSYIGKQVARGRYWFVRMEATFQEFYGKRMILEFECSEKYSEPENFDHEIYFA